MDKLTILVLILSLNSNLFCQEITEEQRDFYAQVLYKADSIRFNKTTHNVFKFEKFKKSDFFNEIVTQEEILSCTKLVKETAKLVINKENQLVLTGKLTERFNTQTTGIFSVDLVENNLLKESGEKFELHTFYNSHSGYGKINFKTDIKSEYFSNQKVTGFVTFKLNYLVGYDKIELSTKDTGREFSLNDCNYSLVNIKGNEIVLNKLCEIENEINAINFNQNGEVAKPYTYIELSKMVEKDSTIAMETFDRKNREAYKMVRDLFEKKPKITLTEFKKIFTVKKLIEMKEKGQYLILESIAPFKNKITLYSANFKSETIRVEMK